MKEQLRFVQILRGFAAIAVLIYHLGIYSDRFFSYSPFGFTFGYHGIDFFFALTGFIITYVHLRETQHQSSVKKFLLKRFIRVYPFYWLVLLIIIGLESPDFHEKPTLRILLDPTSVSGWIIILKNIFLYPLPDSSMVVGIAWGLSHALVFYILFAVGIKLGWKASKFIFAAWLLLILLKSFSIFPASPLLDVFASPLNMQILIGCVAGYLFVKNRIRLTTVYFILMILMVILLLVLIRSQQLSNAQIIETMLMGIASSLVLYYAGTIDRNKLYKNFASPFLILTGDAAYSIFLTHIIFIPYICILFNKVVNVPVIPNPFKTIVIILVFFLAIVAGVLTYLIIERPLLNFLRKKLRLKRQKKSWI